MRGALLRLALAVVEPERGWGLPRAGSADGARIDDLLRQTAWLTGLALLGLTGWMLWSVWRRDAKAPGESSRRTLALALGLFFVIDGNLLFHGLGDVNGVFWNFRRVDAEPDVVRVEVNAHQWAWDLRQAGADGRFGTADDVVALNEVVVPRGRPVLFALGSTDVIHSFYVPAMRLKADAVPGRLNHLWFRPDRVGDFEIACAQHCGMGHYKMRGVLRVVEPAEYDAWLTRQSRVATLGYDPDDQAGNWGWPWRTP